jgi:hypothetical protein
MFRRAALGRLIDYTRYVLGGGDAPALLEEAASLLRDADVLGKPGALS